MKSSRSTARQQFGLTLTLVGLMSCHGILTAFQQRVTRSNNDCAP